VESQAVKNDRKNCLIYSKEILRRELKPVRYVMAGNYLEYISEYLEKMLSPTQYWTPFEADVELDDLDGFDEVEDFIFAEIE